MARPTTESYEFQISLKEAREAVNELVRYIHTFKGFNISEIVEGGSMGHGTTVPDEFDIDLVILSRDVTGRQVLASKTLFQPWLNQIQSFLEKNRWYQFKLKTTRSIQFSYKDKVDVDLLVIPYWDSKDQFYNFLSREVPRERWNDFTVCASKWQVEFFKSQPNEVKEFSRRAKKWRNDLWPVETAGPGRPSSYLMTLLVALAYHESATRRASDVTEALKSIVRKGHSLSYSWDNATRKYPSLVPTEVPYIIDPANPANNVWHTGFKGYRRGVPPNYHQLKEHIGSIDLSKAV